MRVWLVRAVVAASLWVAVGAAAASFELPELTRPASHEQHAGKVIWTDLVTPDAGSAEGFYGALFGWTFRNVPGDPNYTLAVSDGVPVGGIYQKAIALGGKMLVEPRPDRHGGQLAVLADAQGTPFGVMQLASDDTGAESAAQ